MSEQRPHDPFCICARCEDNRAILALFPDLARAQEAAKIQAAVEWLRDAGAWAVWDSMPDASYRWSVGLDKGRRQAHGETMPEAVASLRLKLEGEQT